MSKIEEIGKKLYGASWQSELARALVNADGTNLARQTVQSWHKRDILPDWAVIQLAEIAKQRLGDVKEALFLITVYQGLLEHEQVDSAVN